MSALSGRTLQGPANIAAIYFEALGAHSGLVPLKITGVQGTQPNGSQVGNTTGMPGQVAVVAAEPLLQVGIGTNSTFILTLYGNPGSNYMIQSSSDLGGNNWQSNMNLILSNVVNPILVGGSGSNPRVQFYRAYQQ